jgi:hypothetical protein
MGTRFAVYRFGEETMKVLILALSIALALPLCAQVKITEAAPDRIAVEIDGKPYTNFYLAPNGNKPYVWPLRTAGGAIVTRHFPMEEFPGEIKDHPHHRGMFFSHGDVSGINFWATEPPQADASKKGESRKGAPKGGGAAPRLERGSMKLEKVVEMKGGGKSGVVKAVFAGMNAAGKPVMKETRTLVFHKDKALRTIDYEILIDPLETLVFRDTKEGTFGIRLAASMQEDQGKGGVMTNAEGAQTEKSVWGKRSAWVDYCGPVDGKTVGVAILDHPSNPRHPTYWHSRGYGLHAANIFGVRDFTGDKTQDGSLTVEPGKPVRFRYRVVIHEGDTQTAKVAELFKRWAAVK